MAGGRASPFFYFQLDCTGIGSCKTAFFYYSGLLLGAVRGVGGVDVCSACSYSQVGIGFLITPARLNYSERASSLSRSLLSLVLRVASFSFLRFF